jgi:tetratricopeptide (TPR) repeat protein
MAGATLPVLSSLVDKALLRRTNVGRYEIHELIRQFAETQLHANATWVEQARQRHRDYFVDFLATRAAGVKGGRQKESMAVIQADIDNIRLIWQQAVAKRDAAAFAGAAECLFVYYLYTSGHYEGQNAFQQAASAFIANINASNHPAASVEPVVLANQENLAAYLLAGHGYFLGRTHDANRGEILIEQALALLRRSMTADRRTEGFARLWLAWMYLLQGKPKKARECAKSTLTILTEVGDLWAQGWLFILWANTLMEARPPEAEEVYKRGLAVCEQSGDLNMAGYTGMMRAIANMNLGRYVQAKQYIDNAAKKFAELGNRLGMGYCLQRQSELSLLLGDYEQTIQVGQQAVAIFDEVRTEKNVISTQINLAKAYWLAGNHAEAKSLLQQLLQALTIHNETWEIAHCSFALGCIACDEGELEQAEEYLEVALAQYQQQGIEGRVADVYRCLGQVMVAYGSDRYPEARLYYRQALELTTVHQLAPVALDSCVDVASFFMQTGKLTDAIPLLTLAQEHEASTFATKQRARQLLAELSPQGIDEIVKSLDLWATVEKLLAALAE